MYPDERGYFGHYGGRFVPETLIGHLESVESAYHEAVNDPAFMAELNDYLTDYVGRPTPLYFARHLTETLGGAKILLKREDLNHTGSHKINNTVGQALLARRMGKTRLIAETGAGQHGVATATVAAMLGMECTVHMGAKDVDRQRLNVFRMQMLGADVRPVHKGTKTLKEATNEAFRDFIATFDYSHMVIGSAIGPHPYPMMVRNFQSIIGREVREQMLSYSDHLPDYVIACVGGGSNSIGIFHPFLDDPVRLIGVEGGGLGLDTHMHCATISKGQDGILHGTLSRLLQDEHGQVLETHSVSAGLDYPGVGPEHAFLAGEGRVHYTFATDEETLAAFSLLCRTEGIIPALESAHAVAAAVKLAPTLPPEQTIVVNLSGRGDKDVETVLQIQGGIKQ